MRFWNMAAGAAVAMAAFTGAADARAEEPKEPSMSRGRGIAFLVAGGALLGAGLAGVSAGASCGGSPGHVSCTPTYLGAGLLAASAPLVVLGLRDVAMPVSVAPTKTGATVAITWHW